MVQMFNNYLDSFNEVTTIGPQNIDNVTLVYSANQLKVKDSGISTIKVQDLAITEPKLADNAVSTRTIQDGAVTSTKVNISAITTGLIADGAVTEPKLANNAVSTRTIQDLAVTDAKITSVSGSKVTGGINNFITDMITFIISAVTYAYITICTATNQWFIGTQSGDIILGTATGTQRMHLGIQADGTQKPNITMGATYTNFPGANSIITVLSTIEEAGLGSSSFSTQGGMYVSKRLKANNISSESTITATTGVSGNTVSSTTTITAGSSLASTTTTNVGTTLQVNGAITDRPVNIKANLTAGITNEWITLFNSSNTSKWGINDYLGQGLNFSEVGVADLRLFLKYGSGIGVGNNCSSGYTGIDVTGTSRFANNVQMDGTLNVTSDVTSSTTKTDTKIWISANDALYSSTLSSYRYAPNLWCLTNGSNTGTSYISFDINKSIFRTTANKGMRIKDITIAYSSTTGFNSASLTITTNAFGDNTAILQNTINFTGTFVVTASATAIRYRTFTLTNSLGVVTPLWLNTDNSILNAEFGFNCLAAQQVFIYGCKVNLDTNYL